MSEYRGQGDWGTGIGRGRVRGRQNVIFLLDYPNIRLSQCMRGCFRSLLFWFLFLGGSDDQFRYTMGY